MNKFKHIIKQMSFWLMLVGALQLFYSFYLAITAESRTDELTACFHALSASMMFLFSHVVGIYKELNELRELSLLNSRCVHGLYKEVRRVDNYE